MLKVRCGSGVPQGQEKLSQVPSFTSATWKLSQSISLATSFINCSNAGWCKCTNRFIMWVLYLEAESVLFGKIPFRSYGSALRLDQGRSLKAEHDAIWTWHLKEPLNNGINPAHRADLPAQERQGAWPQARQELWRHIYFLLLSQEMKMLLMSVIYKQESRQNHAFHELQCTALRGQGRKRWVDTSYCVWFARLLVLIELHFTIYLWKQIPFQAFS